MMKTILKKALPTILVGVAFLVFAVSVSAGLVDIRLVQPDGLDELERNSSYVVECVIETLHEVEISGIQLDIEYEHDKLESVDIVDRIHVAAPGVVWQLSLVDPVFRVEGDWTTGAYFKGRTEPPYWSPEAGEYIIYRFTFKVRRDAPLGNSKIKFTTTSIADEDGNNIINETDHFDFKVVVDQTPPVTSASPSGFPDAAFYNYDRTVSLSINEPGTIYYRVRVDGGGWTPEDYSVYTIPIPISADEDETKQYEIQFYGIDDPLDTDPNEESPPNLHTYWVDKEPPEISNIQADPDAVGLDWWTYITFDVHDASETLRLPRTLDSVEVGTQGASWISGTGVGEHTWRRRIDGTEGEGYVDVTVKVTDRAGNVAFATATDLIFIDTQGPEWTITPSDDPVYLEQMFEIDIEADEPITDQENPVVTVGGEAAFFSARHNETEFTYLYRMTGRGWEAWFDHLDIDADWDKDGLPNWWELFYGLDPRDPFGPDGPDGVRSDARWTNLAHYRYLELTDRMSDPNDPDDGGQALQLRTGWNLISYTTNTVWYVGSQPGGMMANVEFERVEDDDWNNFFTAEKFAGSAGNLGAVRVWRDGTPPDYKYFRPGDPPGTTDLDYISPGDGIWVRMDAPDVLILDGWRVPYDGSREYDEITLSSGWHLIGVLPMTRFYVAGRPTGAGIPGPNDLQYTSAHGTIEEMLQNAFGISSSDWQYVETVQMFYPGVGGLAWSRGVPDWAQSLTYAMTGYGAWIEVGDTITIRASEPVH